MTQDEVGYSQISVQKAETGDYVAERISGFPELKEKTRSMISSA